MSKIKKTLDEKLRIKSLRSQLALGFILFSLVLMALLFVTQAITLNKYYETSMDRKAKHAVDRIENLYKGEKPLSFKELSMELVRLSRENDVYIYIEDISGEHGVSSQDFAKVGRFFADADDIISNARANLESSGGNEVSLIVNLQDDAKVAVRAARVESSNRPTINLYAIAAVTPIGPTVNILRRLLFIVTIVALVLGGFVSAFIAKGYSRPILNINDTAKELAKGNYDVNFDTGSNISEIKELSGTLNYAAQELGRADALQKDLLANVSHDLRTPLTMVKSYAEMIRDISGDDPVKRDQHLGVIIEEADRLGALVGDILLISKMQSGTLELESKEFDIQRAAENVFAPYMVLEQEGYKFNFVKIPAGIIVKGDESKLQQVISNLISNAVRYSREKEPSVTLSFNKVAEDRVRISVADNGIGIPQDQLEGIWNRYQRASKSAGRALSGGTGLGLSIVREILEHSSATYGVNSKEGEGSTFWFEIECEFV